MKQVLATIIGMMLICSVQKGLAASQSASADGSQNDEISSQSVCIWQGIHCGMLFGPNFNIGTDRVASASVVNGVIRVSDDQNVTLNPIFDIQYFLWGTPTTPQIGFFAGGGAAINNGVAGTFAFGPIVQFPKNAENLYPIDVAIGVTVVPNTQVLGAGDYANHPPPDGESAVRYEKTTTFGVFLGFGVGFNI